MPNRGKISTLCLLTAVCLFSFSAFAEDNTGKNVLTQTQAGLPLLNLKLDESASIAINNSHNIAAQTETAYSALESARSERTKVYPHISAQGNTKYMSKVGQVSVPGVGQFQAGQNYNWSVGAVLDWVAWDAGQIAKRAKSLSYNAKAQDIGTQSVKRNVLLNSRMSYFGVQLASEQLRLVYGALTVARSQFADVSQRYNVGSASRLDYVSAHQDVMEREKNYEDAMQELAVQLRALFAVLSLDQVAEPAAPADVRFASGFKSVPIQPDFLLNLDSIESSITAMQPRAKGVVEIEKHPTYESAFEQTNSAKLSYEAAKAGHWPKVTVQGSSTYQYPNFAVAERVQQNIVSVGLNLPVIDWGMISKEARSRRHAQNASVEQMRETEVNLSKTYAQTKDQIEILKKTRETAAAKSKDATEAAKLVYIEYLAGRVIFLEVQRANNVALEAQVDEARTSVAYLGELAKMESLITDQ